MDKNKLQDLYNLNVELEGLLRVLEQRENASAIQLLKTKFDQYSAAMNDLLSIDKVIETPEVEEDTQIITGDIGNADVSESDSAASAIADTELDHLIDRTEHQLEHASEAQPVIEHIAHENPERNVATDSVMGRTVSSRVVASIKVDEMVARNESVDLRKAFTLNDKFRFRRELFGGNDEEFNHTISVVSSMHSYEEAYNYLISHLLLNENDETVNDFLTIIRRHFPV